MIEPELKARLDAIEAKVDAAMKAAQSVRRWIFWTGVITVAVIVLPLIGLAFVLPSFVSTYTSTYPALLNNQPVPQSQAQSETNLLNQLGL